MRPFKLSVIGPLIPALDAPSVEIRAGRFNAAGEIVGRRFGARDDRAG